MGSILNKPNRHLFIEDKDNMGNSFIANVNFLVNKFSDIKDINSKFTADDIASIRELLDSIKNASPSQETPNQTEEDSQTEQQSSSDSSKISQDLGLIIDDLIKGSLHGCRKLDINLLKNFADYNENMTDDEKRQLWSQDNSQVYYSSMDVYFVDKTFITKEFTSLVRNHHQLRDQMHDWPELAEKMGGTGIEIVPNRPLYNHELLRIYDTTFEGSTIESIVLHVVDEEQCGKYAAVFSGVKDHDPRYSWMDTTSVLTLVANILPTLQYKAEEAITKATQALENAEAAEDLMNQAVEASAQACECAETAVEAQQDIAAKTETIVERAQEVMDNITTASASANAAKIYADNAEKHSDLAMRYSTNAALEVLEKVQAGIITAKYENYPDYLRVYLDSNNKFLWGIRNDGSIEWSEGVPKPVREEIAKVGYLVDNFNEYIRCYTDSEGHLLWGIKKDGSVEWVKGVPTGVKKYLDEHYGEIDTDNIYIYKYTDSTGKFIFGIKKDGSIEWEKGIPTGIKKYLDAHYGEISEDNLYIHKYTDSNGRVLFGIKKDGSINWFKGIPDGVKDYLDNIYGYETSNEEYLKMYVDAEGKFIFGIRKDGSIEWLNGVPTAIKKYFDTFMYRDGSGSLDLMSVHDSNNQVIEAIDIKGHRIFNKDVFIEGDLRVDGRIKGVEQIKGVHNWTRKKDLLHIPIPECAVVKIENFIRPADKIQMNPAKIEFWDMRGNYFQKKVNIGLQGNTTWNLPKPNYKFDLFADDWNGDEFLIKFGDWVAQDSFHLKAYYTDFLCGRATVIYQWWQEICKTRGIAADTTWKQALIHMDEVSLNMPALGGEEDVELRLDTGAKCVPDGFPCLVYINDTFHGIFSWSLKKHKDNYHIKKNNPNQIHLDGSGGSITLWMGNILWSYQEIRYPKDLFCENGTIYDGDLNIQEIMGADSELFLPRNLSDNKPKDSYLVIHYRDDPDLFEKYQQWDDIKKDGKKEYDKEYVKQKEKGKSDSVAEEKALEAQIKKEKKSIQKMLDSTVQTKANIERLSHAIPELLVLNDAYDADPTPENYQAVRSKFEEYFYPDNIIDYNILIDVDGDWDAINNNCQWLTWDGNIWFANVYDANGAFGGNNQGNGPILTNYRATNKHTPFYYTHKYYTAESEARYAQLRRLGLLDADYIFGKLNNWVKRIGIDYYDQEFKLWPQQPSISNATINTNYWELVVDNEGNPVTGNSNTYDVSRSYEIGDEVYSSFCRISNGFFQFYQNEAGIYKFRCIRPNRGIWCFKNISLADNIWHLYKWYQTQLIQMDIVYNFSN